MSGFFDYLRMFIGWWSSPVWSDNELQARVYMGPALDGEAQALAALQTRAAGHPALDVTMENT